MWTRHVHLRTSNCMVSTRSWDHHGRILGDEMHMFIGYPTLIHHVCYLYLPFTCGSRSDGIRTWKYWRTTWSSPAWVAFLTERFNIALCQPAQLQVSCQARINKPYSKLSIFAVGDSATGLPLHKVPLSVHTLCELCTIENIKQKNRWFDAGGFYINKYQFVGGHHPMCPIWRKNTKRSRATFRDACNKGWTKYPHIYYYLHYDDTCTWILSHICHQNQKVFLNTTLILCHHAFRERFGS